MLNICQHIYYIQGPLTEGIRRKLESHEDREFETHLSSVPAISEVHHVTQESTTSSHCSSSLYRRVDITKEPDIGKQPEAGLKFLLMVNGFILAQLHDGKDFESLRKGFEILCFLELSTFGQNFEPGEK